MPRFIVERPLPNIGDAGREEQLSMLRVSGEILSRLGADRIRWIESVFTCDKAYCFYEARDAETIREFSQVGGFPFDRITEVRYVLNATSLDPTSLDPTSLDPTSLDPTSLDGADARDDTD